MQIAVKYFRLVVGRISRMDFHSSQPQQAPRVDAAAVTPNVAPFGGWQPIVDGIPDPALVLSANAIVLVANAQAATIFPKSLGRHVTIMNRSPVLRSAVEAALSTGAQQSFELRIIVPVERVLTGLLTPNLADRAMLLVLADRTETEQLAQLRADFVANASHELRTPLASLRGYVETLQGAAKDDAAARERFLPIMLTEAERMSRLIDDLLSLSRIEMREHVPPRDTVDLRAIATDTVTSLLPQAAKAGIALTLDATPQRTDCLGDRDELLQVAHNLIQNAIKYGRRDGRIDVSIRAHGRRLDLIVTDDGIGISPEHVPRLTERFYRVSAKHSRERGGTGLGLAIVKHIVNRHHGELTITSKLGQGSTFTVHLPSI